MKTIRRRDQTSNAVPRSEVGSRAGYGRRRAACLASVYLLVGIHIAHWKLSGSTLAPLELNEVMYTLELGIITAGFLFMCTLCVGTMIFGRFFCSWACHIIALQDLCAWLLSKVGIRRKPIRSRLLLLVPPLTAAYMFVWPQAVRAWREQGFPEFHLRTDAEGWASFATTDFWRNLPGPWVITMTFLVCGFGIVYLLGSRTFCAYVCPYGAVFGLADRFAPGRIRVNDDCQQCGTCTAVCSSGIRVHEEVAQHGMVINSACLKDLDCVGACPQNALRYAFGKPALFKSWSGGGRFGSLPYHFTWPEELAIGAVFVLTVLIFRGLYGSVPFLLSLAGGAILAYWAVVTARLFRRSDAKLGPLRLKTAGKVRLLGRVFVGVTAILASFVAHSGFVRYHEYRGLRTLASIHGTLDLEKSRAQALVSFKHLSVAEQWGLVPNARVEHGLVDVGLMLGRNQEAASYARRILERFPGDTHTGVLLAQALAADDRLDEAEKQIRGVVALAGNSTGSVNPVLIRANQTLGSILVRQGAFSQAADVFQQTVKLDDSNAASHAQLGSVYAELGRLEQALEHLRRAAELDDGVADTHYNAGTILAHLGRFDEAIIHYRRALELTPDSDSILNNLGFAELRLGDLAGARRDLELALQIRDENPDVHFNLANVLVGQGLTEQASEHYLKAAQLDPRYARLLKNRP